MNKLTVNHSTDTGLMELDEITKLTGNPLDVAVATSSSVVVTEEPITGPSYNVVPHPGADAPDWSGLRGVPKLHAAEQMEDSEHDLENLAELVPDIKARRSSAGGTPHPLAAQPSSPRVLDDSGNGQEEAVEVVETTNMEHHHTTTTAADAKKKTGGKPPKPSLRKASMCSTRNDNLVHRVDSMLVQDSMDVGDGRDTQHRQRKLSLNHHHHPSNNNNNNNYYNGAGADPSSNNVGDSTSYDEDYNGSDQAYNDNNQDDITKMPKEFVNMESSAQSISTATQTHEVRMPMYLPTFKPATGCTNASDFIVRCFVARLRCGITVVKHGRSRWCKSRLRILHIHPDGRSLSWKPAEGEPTSSKRPPKLDLSTCLEVRHAWSPDPQNPMYTGTPILRQKCEAANAHKSFALIFKQRTVDVTAVTADQCKVLMEGFSALCFRLQVANLATAGGAKGKTAAHARPMPEEDGVSTTASNTLTNNSTRRT